MSAPSQTQNNVDHIADARDADPARLRPALHVAAVALAAASVLIRCWLLSDRRLYEFLQRPPTAAGNAHSAGHLRCQFVIARLGVLMSQAVQFAQARVGRLPLVDPELLHVGAIRRNE